ncbi:Protein kinase domain [Trypanosoma melophagium]|uniref:Protein kinase domain n=1 Tax=Trypanosoma melophagium TaxID=715481 RepID=UPI00351A9D51|nr:Protein kinase domain [Trypanosoma melophagium]
MENYTLCGKIGNGAEGVVFNVKHNPTNKGFAMKVVRCTDHSKVNEALKEIKVLLQLRHQHVVSYVDFFLIFPNNKLKQEFTMASKNNVQLSDSTPNCRMYSTNGLLGGHELENDTINSSNVFCMDPSEVCVCLVMELCTCGDMQSMIRDAKQRFMENGTHPITEAQILSWMEQCASALTFIHEQGFIHRDLKPTNIFFDNYKDVKIGDFGLAAAVGLGRQSIVGTPLYSAPERMLHQVYDEKVDVWGLGVVMLELVTLCEQPINSRVLENPLVVEKVVEQVRSMGFTSKLGGLLRDMLQRFPEARPTPAAILHRLSGMTTGPISPCGISIPSISLGMSCPKIPNMLCELCEVETAVSACTNCSAILCEACDRARHKHHTRQSHERTSLSTLRSSQSTRAHVLSDVDSNSLPPLKLKQNCSASNTFSRFLFPVFSAGGTSMCGTSITDQSSSVLLKSVNNVLIRVPQDCPTITAALSTVQHMPYIRKIVVSGNTIHKNPIILGEHLPDNIKIIGENPSPVIEVDDASSAITCTSGSGTIENFIIRHAGRRSSTAESRNSEKVHKKSTRPIAVSITGGEWKITKCRISCCSGSGISVAADVEAVISHCLILEVKTAGVVVLEGGRGLFEKNSFTNCDFAAFLLKKKSSARIRGNHITEGAETGIFCQDASGVVEDNFIANNGGCGVVTKGSDTNIIFRGNRIVANGQAGFFCCDGASPIISDNDIRQNNRAGILIKTRASPKITKNTISSGKEAGIYVFENGAGLIECNELLDNSNAGILVTTNGKPHVVGNIIRGNLYEGVWICKDGGGIFCENDLRDNKKGPKDIESGNAIAWVGNREA